MTAKKRWAALKNHKGIRKDLVTGKYVAGKYIDKKEYSESFDNLTEALAWRRNFHPLLTNAEINIGPATKHSTEDSFRRVTTRLNGSDQRYNLGQVWELYKSKHLPSLEPQTIEDRVKFARYFFPDLLAVKMVELTPELLDAFMEKKVKEARALKNPRRFNFDNDLKCLKAILNWYRENYDGMFTVPILKRHYISGIVKQKPKRRSPKMKMEQVQLFLNSFDCEFWRDFAELHFYMAGRCQEVAGLQWESVDFKEGFLYVCDVAIWGESKRFVRLKETPKNGEERTVHLNSTTMAILERRLANKSETPCNFFRESTKKRLDFVFEIDGEPVTYRQIQYNYNKALKKADLYPEFTSTHILRKAMTNIVRQGLGLDAAQAAGGWKSRDVVEKNYSDAPNKLNKEAVWFVEKLAMGAASNLGQTEAKEFSRHLRLVDSDSES